MTDSTSSSTSVPTAPSLSDPITASAVQHGDWIRALEQDPWLVVVEEPHREDRSIDVPGQGPQLINITSFNVQIEGKGSLYPWSGYSSLAVQRKRPS